MVKIIAGYPACGKTYYVKHNDNAVDLEYSHYAWIRDENGNKIKNKNGEKIRNFAFPQNYLNAIMRAYKKYNSLVSTHKNSNKDWYIFINAHPEVLSNLIQHNIPVTVVIPCDNIRDKWIERFNNRNDDIFFVKQQARNYDVWVEEIRANAENFDEIIELTENEYISDIIKGL